MNYAIIELHDVSPYYKKEFLSALELLEDIGIDKYTLLVVPYFWEMSSLISDTDFVRLVKEIKKEVVLHGYTHKGKSHILWTDGEGEFGGLDLYETYRRVQEGIEIFQSVGLVAEFFVPPAWIGNVYLEDVLYAFCFRGVAYRFFVRDIETNTCIQSPVITFSNRHLLSWFSIKSVSILKSLYKKSRVLRLALHMADFRDERKVKLWREILREIKNVRRFISYEELFSKGGFTLTFKGFQPSGRLV